jgi:uncharacterized integral membrane protein
VPHAEEVLIVVFSVALGGLVFVMLAIAPKVLGLKPSRER